MLEALSSSPCPFHSQSFGNSCLLDLSLNWGGEDSFKKHLILGGRHAYSLLFGTFLIWQLYNNPNSTGSRVRLIHLYSLLFKIFFKDFISLFLETGEGREKEGERSINVWLPLAHPQLGTCPITQACTLTSNQQPLDLQTGAQSTEPHQPGLIHLYS